MTRRSTPITLANVRAVLDALWPVDDALDWDAVGLVVGHPGKSVESIRLVVDVVPATVAEAIADGVDLIIAHHPLMLRGVTSVSEEHYKGTLVSDLIRADVSLLSAHTNADAATLGTSEVLGRALGLTQMEPISVGESETTGIGRVGLLPTPTRLYDFVSTLGGLLPATAGGLRVSGDPEAMVQRVAVCSGAGDSLLGHDRVRSADVYVTADLRHHPASEAQATRQHGGGPALVDVSHFGSEWFFLDSVKDHLENALPGVRVSVSEIVTDPWDFVVHPGSPSA